MRHPIYPTPVLPSRQAWPLHDVASTRALEDAALATSAPHLLMQRAGLATARLAAAVVPHGRRAWVLAGPGNNGGDALVAARCLHLWGWQVQVSLLGDAASLPADARDALRQAQAAGVPIQPALPDNPLADVCLDGLLGIGASRAPAGPLAEAIRRLNARPAPVLSIDVPSGLDADRGQPLGDDAVIASHTLALLTLKPGLFTASGRDHAGRVWLDPLHDRAAPPHAAPDPHNNTAPASQHGQSATAWLTGPPTLAARRHAQHKGSQGDLVVLGGAPGMGGAALLAARAALAAGAGRVFVARLDDGLRPGDLLDPQRPELMPRQAEEVLTQTVLARSTVVCGCGGGHAVAALLPLVLRHAGQLLLDADALNALAAQPACWPLLAQRLGATVLTPHPLEAARLLGCSTAEVQADRLRAAQTLADRSQAVVLLKGTGTVLAAPGHRPRINPTGNARLGTAGSGDVLAGWLGGWMASQAVQLAHLKRLDFDCAEQAHSTTRPAHAAGCAQNANPSAGEPKPEIGRTLETACAAAWWHGRAAESDAPQCAADAARGSFSLRANDLIDAMAALVVRTQ